jgi:hypothetical protein
MMAARGQRRSRIPKMPSPILLLRPAIRGGYEFVAESNPRSANGTGCDRRERLFQEEADTKTEGASAAVGLRIPGTAR